MLGLFCFGFRVQVDGFRVQVDGFRVQVDGFRVVVRRIKKEAPRMLMALRAYRYYRESRWEV